MDNCSKNTSMSKNTVHTDRFRLVYLAGPYTHSDKFIEQLRFERLTKVSGLLIKCGIFNFSPITQSHEQNRMVDLPGTWDFWKDVDTEFLHRTDELWVLAEPGWQESKGVTAEIAIMREMGKPVRFIQYSPMTDDVTIITEKQARRITWER